MTPSGPPPIPKNKSTLEFLFVTSSAPATSPSEINLVLILSLFARSIISLCLGLSSKHIVKSSKFLLSESAKFLKFFSCEKSKSSV